MGCGSSSPAAVETTTYPTKPSNGRSKPTEKLTLGEWSEQIASVTVASSKKYSQPTIPDHYTEEEIQFDSAQISEKELKTAINSGSVKSSPPILSLNWPYKRPDAKYSQPDNCFTVDMHLLADSDRQQVLAVGGAYIGCQPAELEQLFTQLSLQSVHSIVFCGNLFDLLSMEPLHEAPSDISQLINKLEDKDTLLAALRIIATTDVKVYYLKGSFDALLPMIAVEKYLGKDIVYVQEESLMFSVNYGGKDHYRARFTSGSQWDLLNYSDLSDNQLVCGHPIGYYLARSALQNPEFSATNLIQTLVRGIPASQEKDIAGFITKHPLQRGITQQLLSTAMSLNIEELVQMNCIVAQAKYIRISTLLEYPYLKFISDKAGKEQMLTMLKAMGGDYSSALSQCQEDVFISGLNDSSNIQNVKGKSGDVLVGCPGNLKQEQPQAVRVTFPKVGMNGNVELVPILKIAKSETPKPENVTTEPTNTVSNSENAAKDNISIEDL